MTSMYSLERYSDEILDKLNELERGVSKLKTAIVAPTITAAHISAGAIRTGISGSSHGGLLAKQEIVINKLSTLQDQVNRMLDTVGGTAYIIREGEVSAKI